ncbi:MAG: flagellar hook-basal body complex protein FliE [Lachnospiraceae bacterium]|nr:flagellar hook-basal body complex protein FliE [Lachnospiraceae bacterium]
MDISNLSGVATNLVSNALENISKNNSLVVSENENTDTAFSNILSSAMGLVNQTNYLSEKAEQAEIDFALGNADSTHDVAVAQQKAYISLQYTVAIKNAVLDAYKEIMNMQI